MAKVECKWCHHDFEEESTRIVHFFGKDFCLCEDDFQLFWNLFGGVGELIKQFRASVPVRK